MVNKKLNSFFLIALAGVAMATANNARAEAPTKADIETALRHHWDKAGKPGLEPRTAVEIKSIKIGSTDKATAQEVVDGVPQGAQVTAVIVDFVVRTYHSDVTRVVRRVREARVYKDKFGEWDIMTGQPRGEDQTSEEPAAR